MKLFFRMLPMLARCRRRNMVAPMDKVTTCFRVLPHDLDINLHLNNGRYMQFIDVNRLEWLLRTGIMQIAIRQRWRAVLGSSVVHFRRELRLFEKPLVETRLVGWDDRWFFLEHTVRGANGRVAAMALAKAAFRGSGDWIPTRRMVEALDPTQVRPALPAHVAAWLAADAGLGALIAKAPAPAAPALAPLACTSRGSTSGSMAN